MRNYKLPAFLLAGLVVGVSAVFAQTEVHELGVAPLLGATSSTPALRQKFAEQPELIREAAQEIGLSHAEYRSFLHKFYREKPYWGRVPRHLDAMSWASDGQVYVLHDVVIPSGVNGWEVDLHEKHQLVKIYIPMACGNLSVVRTPIHQVAVVRPPLPPRHIFEAPPPAPAPVPLVAAEVPPAQELPPVAPPPVIHHPHLFWPIFAAAVAGVVIASNHHGGSSTPSYVPISGGSVLQPGGSGGGGSVMITPPVNTVPPPMHHCGCGS